MYGYHRSSRVVEFTLIVLLSIFLNYFPSFAATLITGKVVSIADGDTITVLQNNQQFKIRLYGIDCPESGQPFGSKAKQLTSDLAFGKVAEVIVHEVDKYGRSVGIVRVDGVNVNEELIRNGYAWRYTQYCKESFCSRWKTLEDQASKQKAGLWTDSSPVPPWDWRSGQKSGNVQVTSEQTSSTERTVIPQPSTGNSSLHGNTSSRIYHNAGCRYYNCGNCTQVFKSGAEAQNSGYRACKICRG